MKAIFRQLILDFQTQELPAPTPREIGSLELPKNLRKAFVLVGMRRSGKTWALYQKMQELLERGISRSQILYLNFEDDRLSPMPPHQMHALLEAYFELFPEHVSNPELHFFFDEIHQMPHWETFIRRLLDTEKMHIYLTGSSAKMLSKEIATSLRGRTLVREVFPYHFREYLHHLDVHIPQALSTKTKAVLTHHAKQYLTWGGFPETVSLSPSLHREILQSYVETVIYRDIVERYQITNIQS